MADDVIEVRQQLIEVDFCRRFRFRHDDLGLLKSLQ